MFLERRWRIGGYSDGIITFSGSSGFVPSAAVFLAPVWALLCASQNLVKSLCVLLPHLSWVWVLISGFLFFPPRDEDPCQNNAILREEGLSGGGHLQWDLQGWELSCGQTDDIGLSSRQSANFPVAIFSHDTYKHALWCFLPLICFPLPLPLRSFYPRRCARIQALGTFLKGSLHKNLKST